MQSYPQMFQQAFVVFYFVQIFRFDDRMAKMSARHAFMWWVELPSTLIQLASVTAQSGERLQQC